MEIFDKSEMLERLGDEDLCKEIIELFVEDAPNQINVLKKAIEQNDAAMIHLHAHSLKGAAANISALRLREIASQIEDAGKGGNIEMARSLITNAEKEFCDFKDYIKIE